MLMRLMSKGEYLIVPKGTKFRGAGELGLNVLKMRKQSPAIIVHILIFFQSSMQNTWYNQVENLVCINVAGEAWMGHLDEIVSI